MVRIGTPNQFVKRWIEESDLLHTLCEALREGFERSLTPELVILRRGQEVAEGEESEDEDEPLPPTASAAAFTQAPALEVPPASSTLRGQLEQDSSIQLKDGYSFDTYIVGPNNRLAHAAALAVAESPGQAYNPLFVHSAVGLGKTHLLQAICQGLLNKSSTPRAKILYLSCEDFVNRFIEAVKDGELEQFRYKYRNVDVLVIDDIHFLADKERIFWAQEWRKSGEFQKPSRPVRGTDRFRCPQPVILKRLKSIKSLVGAIGKTTQIA